MKQETLKTLEKLLTGLVVMDFKKEAEEKIQTCLKEVKEAINYNRCCDKLPQDPIVLARYMHDNYEMLAKNNDWNTQENCKVDFSDLPIGNKNTMILLAGKLILDFGGNCIQRVE